MDWGNCKDILVFLEQKEGKVVNVSLEALTPARTLAGLTGGKVLALAVGTDNAAAAEKAAPLCDGVLSVEGAAFSDGCSDAMVCALEAMVNKYAPAAVLAGNTPLGRELTARLDARKGLGSVQDATALKIDKRHPRMDRSPLRWHGAQRRGGGHPACSGHRPLRRLLQA